MGFLNVSRQRAVEPSAAGGTLSKAAGLVMETRPGSPMGTQQWGGHGGGGSGRLMQHLQVSRTLQEWCRLCFIPLPYSCVSTYI